MKAVDYSFIDDEEDIVGYELGFRTNVLTNQEIPEEDLEYLYKFGEVMLDTRAREAEQSSVTIADLEKILMHIKNAGLVSKRLKTIR